MNEFKSGAKRSEVKPRYDLISKELLDRVAAVWGAGCVKYGERNWQKGSTDFVKDIPNHLIAHIYAYLQNDVTEDHLAHIVCNAQMMMHFQGKEKMPAYVEVNPLQNLNAMCECGHTYGRHIIPNGRCGVCDCERYRYDKSK